MFLYLILLKSGTHSPQLFECVPTPTLFIIIWRLYFSRPLPIHLMLSFLHLRFGFCWPLRAFINCTYLLTYTLAYKLICIEQWAHWD